MFRTTRSRTGRLRLSLLSLPAIALAGYCGWITWLGRDFAPPSRCHGTAVNGYLTHGRRLPYSGENFRAYSLLGYLSGRTFMHGAVRDAVLSSYARVATRRPELRFVYGEGSWPWGGSLWPHRTHANGTSVDFFVPLRTRDGDVAEMPVSVFNKLGYSVGFDLPVRRQIALTLSPAALASTIWERHMTLAGVLRSLTSPSRRARSSAFTVISVFIPIP